MGTPAENLNTVHLPDQYATKWPSNKYVWEDYIYAGVRDWDFTDETLSWIYADELGWTADMVPAVSRQDELFPNLKEFSQEEFCQANSCDEISMAPRGYYYAPNRC